MGCEISIPSFPSPETGCVGVFDVRLRASAALVVVIVVWLMVTGVTVPHATGALLVSLVMLAGHSTGRFLRVRRK